MQTAQFAMAYNQGKLYNKRSKVTAKDKRTRYMSERGAHSSFKEGIPGVFTVAPGLGGGSSAWKPSSLAGRWYGQECRQVTTNSRKRSHEGLQTSPAFKLITEPQLCFSVNLLIFSFAHSWERQMWKLTINTYRGLMPLLSPKSSAVSLINTLCFFINTEIPRHRKLLSERVKIHIQTLSFTSRNGTSRHALTGTARRGQVTPSGWNPLHTRTRMLIKCWFQPRSQRSRIFAFQQYEIHKVKLSC